MAQCIRLLLHRDGSIIAIEARAEAAYSRLALELCRCFFLESMLICMLLRLAAVLGAGDHIVVVEVEGRGARSR